MINGEKRGRQEVGGGERERKRERRGIVRDKMLGEAEKSFYSGRCDDFET